MPARALTAHFTQHAARSLPASRPRRPRSHATRRPLRLPDRAAEHMRARVPAPSFPRRNALSDSRPRAPLGLAPHTFDVSFLCAPTPRTFPCICRVPVHCSHRPAGNDRIHTHWLASEAYAFADMHPCQSIAGLIEWLGNKRNVAAVCFSERGRLAA